MPELPEVETIVRRLRPALQGRRIVGFSSRWRKHAHPSVEAVRGGIVGRTVQHLGRRGKWIVFDLAPAGHMLVHLRMSGRLEWADGHRPRHVRAWWDLEDGQRLLFCDARKFGRIHFATQLAEVTSELGIEPLSRGFTPAVLRARLARRRGRLKPLLLDQTLIAGLGNIYVDEALHRSGLHPLLPSTALAAADIARLHGAIRAVLREAIRHEGTTIDWGYPGGGMQKRLRVYGRGGAACHTCGTPIVYLRVGQRGTHVCPCCQPAPS